jgi:hypothetical protein
MRTILRRAGVGFLVVGFCFAIAFGIAEGSLRLMKPASKPPYDRPKYLVNAPSEKEVRHVGEILPKADGVFRIVVLGDSFTWGTNVEADATYPHHLGWLLDRGSAGAFEVYNYGVAGSSTADQLQLLQSLPRLTPDLVLIGYFLNDPDPGRVLPGQIADVITRLESPPPWERFLRSHSRLAQTVLFRYWAARLVSAQIDYIHHIFRPDGWEWKRHQRELLRLSQLRTELGLDIRVAIWPHLGFRLDGGYPFQEIHGRLREAFAALGIDTIDLMDVFRGMPHERLEAIPGLDPHPNEIAHRLAADAILGWLRESVPAIQAAFPPGSLRLNPPVPSVRLRLEPLGFR